MDNNHIDGKSLSKDKDAVPAQLTLRDGPEVLVKYKWTFVSQEVGAHMVLYKQAALSRSAPRLPPSVREVIKQVFPDYMTSLAEPEKEYGG